MPESLAQQYSGLSWRHSWPLLFGVLDPDCHSGGSCVARSEFLVEAVTGQHDFEYSFGKSGQPRGRLIIAPETLHADHTCMLPVGFPLAACLSKGAAQRGHSQAVSLSWL